MKISVVRDFLTDNVTLGKLYIDKVYHCETLEDKTRTHKIYGETCISVGTYEIKMHWWEKHHGWYPILIGVLNFLGIMIHKGISKDDTEGCILVGMRREGEEIHECAAAFNPLRDKIRKSLKTEQVWCSVELSENAVDKRTSNN